jgi:hypothetical protein
MPDDQKRPEWAVELNDREWIFVDEYLRTFNKAKAFRALPPMRSDAANPDYDSQCGYRFYNRPIVRKAIKRALAERGVGQDYLVDRLVQIIDVDITKLYEADGVTPKNIHDIDSETLAVIAGIEFDKFGRAILKLESKLAALKMFDAALGISKHRMEVSGPDGAPVEVSPGEMLADRLEQLRQKLSNEEPGKPVEG